MTNISRIPNVSMLSRIKACLIGGPIGDAMGMPVETLHRNVILKNYGPVTGFMHRNSRNIIKLAGSWTDETHLSMLTGESILRNGSVDIPDLTNSYIDGLNYDLGIAGTTRRALELRRDGFEITLLKKGRHSGAGAASRMPTVAIYEHQDLESLRVKAEAVSKITHLDNDAVAGAVAVAFSIAWILRGETTPEDLILNLNGIMQQMNSNLLYNFKLADGLLKNKKDTIDGIEEIGADGYSVRLIPSAIFAFLSSPTDFENTILASVNAGGDTDTRAFLAGSISGAYNGMEGIPQNWIRKLQNHQRILDLAEQLYYRSIPY